MATRDRSSSVSVLSSYSDHVNILPMKIPDVIKKIALLSSKISRDSLRKILQVAVIDFENSKAITEDVFENVKSMITSLSDEQFLTLYSGILLLMRYILRHPQHSFKKESFSAELLDLKLSKEFVEDIYSYVSSDRKISHEKTLFEKRLKMPMLESFRWRVDVTISTSVLNRVLEPTILFEMKDSNGSVNTFEVSQSRFHELRYNVAYVLKEMENLERKNILQDK